MSGQRSGNRSSLGSVRRRLQAARDPDAPARVLIVDDNRDIVTVVRRILTREGYASLEAYEGNEALDLARRKAPDLVLLDWMLPGKSGLKVCQELKKDPATRGIMILIVTGRGSVDSRVKGLDAGADDYITKPFHHQELLARVRSALRLKKLTDDLAERNRQLVESQNELVRTEKMATIGLLASGIAHEFNNIMAGISGYAQLARTNPQYLEKLVEVALTQSERAMELTRSLSTLHRRERDRASSSVKEVVAATVCLVKKEVEAHGVELVTNIPDVPYVGMSPGQLQEVLLNMVINAIHAVADDGKITIEASKLNDRAVEIRIRDTGAGIPEEHINRVFDPFFTTKGALGGGTNAGSGLGLSVCYNIVTSHGGKIDVESTEGEGTVFKVTLPVGTEEPDVTGYDEPPKTEAHTSGRDVLRILVVDDEKPIRDMVQEFLRGHEVVCCATGNDALREYEQAPFDFVLLDMRMQDSISGTEVLKKIKELDPEARVILSSGQLPSEVGHAELALAHGHLLKPFKFEALEALLGITASAV